MLSEKQAQLSDVLQQLEERSAVICLVLVRCPGHYICREDKLAEGVLHRRPIAATMASISTLPIVIRLLVTIGARMKRTLQERWLGWPPGDDAGCRHGSVVHPCCDPAIALGCLQHVVRVLDSVGGFIIGSRR